MRSKSWVLVAALVLAALLLFLGIGKVRAASTEQVYNGGAEDGMNGWTVTLASVSSSTADPHSGSRCFLFNGGGSEIWQAFGSPVTVKSVRLFAALAQSGIMTVSITVKYQDGKTFTQEFMTSSSTYQELDLAGLDQSKPVVGIYVSCIGIQAYHVYIDDVSLVGSPADALTLGLLFILAALVVVSVGLLYYARKK